MHAFLACHWLTKPICASCSSFGHSTFQVLLYFSVAQARNGSEKTHLVAVPAHRAKSLTLQDGSYWLASTPREDLLCSHTPHFFLASQQQQRARNGKKGMQLCFPEPPPSRPPF